LKTAGIRAVGLLKIIAVCTGVVVITLVAAASWLLWPVLSDPVPGFAERKGELLEFRETGHYELGDSRITEITLKSSSGLQVQLALRRPHQPLAGNPVFVLIAGQETGRDAAMMFHDTHGVTVAALSYLYEGGSEFSRLGLAMDLHKVQRAILDTSPAVMLTNDYLLEHAQPKPAFLELVGVSFGAFLAAVPAALDERINRLWLIHGAGEPARVIDRGLEGKLWPAPLRALVAEFLTAAVAGSYLAPELWVGRVAPRPVLVINGRDDDDIPRQAVSALHRSLGHPHEVIWVDGGHIHPKRPQTISRVIDLMFSRMVGDD
jgi:pimeloyl-ACP methyl ester carboxylesterase